MYWIRTPFRYLSLVAASVVLVFIIVVALIVGMFFLSKDELKATWKFHDDQGNWGWGEVKEFWGAMF